VLADARFAASVIGVLLIAAKPIGRSEVPPLAATAVQVRQDGGSRVQRGDA
jgi:hypothetical protein